MNGLNEDSSEPLIEAEQCGVDDGRLSVAGLGEAEAAFEHLPILAWIAAADGAIFRYNRAWREYTGLSDDVLAGWGWQQAHHPDHLPRVMREWQRALASGEPFELTFPLRGADGHYRAFQTRAVPYRDATGAILRWFGTNTDVSALEEAEHRAEDSRRTLETVVEHVPAMVYTKDRDYRLTLANQAVIDAIGRSAAEVIGATDDLYLDAEGFAAVRTHDRRVLELGETLEGEEEVRFEDGRARTYLSRKAPLLGRDGAVVGLVGSSMDITERKATQRALEDREAYLRRVLDQMFTFVGITTTDGVLTFSNTAPLEAGGLVAEEVWGRLFWECPWWAYSEDAQAICREAIRTAAAGGVYRRDVVVRMAGDQRLTIDYQAGPLRDEAGEIIALVHSGVGIEDRVRAEQLKDALIGELHHRVKNLFAMVIAIIQSTARQADDVGTLTDALVGRVQALGRSIDLIRPRGGDGAGESKADLASLVESLIEPHGAERFTIAGPPIDVPPGATAPLALVVHELATNAVKYGALSARGGRCSIGWHDDDARLLLVWEEQGGPRLAGPPGRVGYGSKLVDLATRGQLGATISRQWLPDGLRVEISIASDRLTG